MYSSEPLLTSPEQNFELLQSKTWSYYGDLIQNSEKKNNPLGKKLK